MDTRNPIDTTINFEADASGEDPDTHSPTLRRYHRLLWSKPLPDGTPFELVETGPYLRDRTGRGAVSDSAESNILSSDYIVPTFTLYRRNTIARIVAEIPAPESEAFRQRASTIGAKIVWPAARVPGVRTMNQARGFHPSIADRFDLTLECIRRYYLAQQGSAGALGSPLQSVILGYRPFFDLFVDFEGYVSFFLLEDLLTDAGHVAFFAPFDDFRGPAVPGDLDTYLEYRRRSLGFVDARNARIASWASAHLRQ